MTVTVNDRRKELIIVSVDIYSFIDNERKRNLREYSLIILFYRIYLQRVSITTMHMYGTTHNKTGKVQKDIKVKVHKIKLI